MDEKDIPPAAGKRPPQAEAPDPRLGTIGTGDDYSRQEYDSPGQAEWREEDRAKSVPADGVVRGSGTGGAREEYDAGNSAGAFSGVPSAKDDQA